MEWDLTNTSGFVAGVISIMLGFLIIIFPRMLAIMIGLYLILIGALAIWNAVD